MGAPPTNALVTAPLSIGADVYNALSLSGGEDHDDDVRTKDLVSELGPFMRPRPSAR